MIKIMKRKTYNKLQKDMQNGLHAFEGYKAANVPASQLQPPSQHKRVAGKHAYTIHELKAVNQHLKDLLKEWGATENLIDTVLELKAEQKRLQDVVSEMGKVDEVKDPIHEDTFSRWFNDWKNDNPLPVTCNDSVTKRNG